MNEESPREGSPAPVEPATDLLALLEEGEDDRFTRAVARGIDRREAATSIVHLSWVGFFSLVLEYMDSLFGVLPHSDPGEETKE